MSNTLYYDGKLEEIGFWNISKTDVWFRVYVMHEIAKDYINKSYFKFRLYWKLYAWWHKIPSWTQSIEALQKGE